MAVEYWSGGIKACFQCTDPSKVEPYTNSNDLGYPVHVWVRGKYTLRIPPHERSWGGGGGGGGEGGEDGGYVTSPNIVYLGSYHWLGAEAVKQHM